MVEYVCKRHVDISNGNYKTDDKRKKSKDKSKG